MTPYEKIRKALNTGDSCDLLTAMDAIDELEADAAHLRTLARMRFGYAPGDYSGICIACSEMFIGGKRAATCPKCADAAIDTDRKARAGNGGEG